MSDDRHVGRMLFGLDLDETVVQWHTDPESGDRSWTVSERVRAAIRGVIEHGHEVVVVTGRSLQAVEDLLEDLHLAHGYAACSNGALIVEFGDDTGGSPEILRSTTFDPAPVADLLRREFPGSRLGFVTEAGFSAPDGYAPMWASELEVIDLEGEVLNVFGKVPCRHAQDVVDVVAPGGHTVYWADHEGQAWIDIVGPGVSKGAGLAWIAQRLGVEQADTVAIGDGVNDVDLLAWAGTGVAMGNASERVQSVADRVTGSVAEDGVAQVLEEFLAAPAGPA